MSEKLKIRKYIALLVYYYTCKSCFNQNKYSQIQ